MKTALEENYRRVRDRIGEAALRSGRRPESVRLVGVTKKIGVDRVREAIGLGLTEIGENRVQEAEAKLPHLSDLEVRCHLIGHLQSNKAKTAVRLFSCIQSVDSVGLAERLERLVSGALQVFVQVKLGDEATKSGVEADQLQALIDRLRAMSRLRLVGLMGIPPFFPDPDRVRPYFRQLRDSAEQAGLPEVSMGMSHDFEVAIEEGATLVRIGTALFGARE
jgi:pyridoxal phosphate enzyme (YggS family)